MEEDGPTLDAGQGGHRTVSRVMTILERVVASEDAGTRLADLATSIGAPKSSLHGLCKGLVATGYLREEDGRYFLGPAISGLLAAGQDVFPASFRPALQGLTDRLGETAVLVALVGDSAVYLTKTEPETMIRASPPTNVRLPLWPRSSGKVFLANMPAAKRESFLKRQFRDPAERDRAREELAAVQRTGIASRIENGEGGVAAPVAFGDRPITVAITIVGPAERMEGRTDEIAADLLHTVRQIAKG